MAITAFTSVGVTSSTPSGSITTATLSTSAAVTAGGLIVIGVAGWNAAGTGSQTPTLAGGGLTWTRDKFANTGQFNMALFSAPAPSGLASATTLTCTWPSNHNGRGIGGGYMTGQDSVPVEATSSATGTGTAGSGGTVTTAANGDLVVGFMFGDTPVTSSTAGTNYTELWDRPDGSNPQTFTMVYRLNAPAGSNNPTNTWAASVGTWEGVSAAYLEAVVALPPEGNRLRRWQY